MLEGKNKRRPTPATTGHTGGATSTVSGYTGGATSTSIPVRPRGLEWLPTLRVPLTPIKPPNTDTPTPVTYSQLGGLPNYETGRELARIYAKGGGAMLKTQESQLVQYVKQMSKAGSNATASVTTNVVTIDDTEDSNEPDTTRNDEASGRENQNREPQSTWKEASRVAGPSGVNRSKPKPGPASKTKNIKTTTATQRVGPLKPTLTPTSTPSSTSTTSEKSTPKRKSETDSTEMNHSNLKQRKSNSNSNKKKNQFDRAKLQKMLLKRNLHLNKNPCQKLQK